MHFQCIKCKKWK